MPSGGYTETAALIYADKQTTIELVNSLIKEL